MANDKIWFLPQNRKRNTADVTLSNTTHADWQSPKFTFTFRNGIADRMFPKNDRMLFGYADDRIYFEDSEEGWVVTKQSGTKSRYCTITSTKDMKPILDKMVGDYTLKEDNGQFYIEKEN